MWVNKYGKDNTKREKGTKNLKIDSLYACKNGQGCKIREFLIWLINKINMHSISMSGGSHFGLELVTMLLLTKFKILIF